MELFTFLWFNFLKVLLNYAESCSKLPLDSESVQQFKQQIKDNIQRVFDYLIQENILNE